MPNNDIMVSINCLTYNHEKYIRKCLDGFLMQKTNFKFEVLIHDDASTDHTADIIREYEQKYPDIIKPIYQKENQYSKGVKIGLIYQYPRARGKYIAVCEGDDCWTSPYKIEKQYPQKVLDISMPKFAANLCVSQLPRLGDIRNVFLQGFACYLWKNALSGSVEGILYAIVIFVLLVPVIEIINFLFPWMVP